LDAADRKLLHGVSAEKILRKESPDRMGRKKPPHPFPFFMESMYPFFREAGQFHFS
jgi:hypothetical protein